MIRKKPPRSDEPTTVDVASILSALHRPFETADADRATSLASIANARVARGYMMKRVRDERALRLGVDAPEVVKLDAAIAANTELAVSLATESNLAATPQPTAAAGETIVRGFVRDAAGVAVEGVKLTLAEPKGDVLATTASAKDGHFVLRHETKREKVPEKIEVRVHDKRHPDPIDLERGNGVVIVMVRLED
jgi:hypothetical protein